MGKPIEIRRKHALALLAFLSLESGWHSRERLAAMLWSQADTISSQQSLRTVLAHLRDVLGESADVLETTRSKIQLLPSYCDVQEIRNPKDAELEAASRLYRNDFLSDLQLPDAPEFDLWLEQNRAQTRADFDVLLSRLLAQQQHQGLEVAALETARRRANFDALNEAAHRGLMQVLLDQGNRTAAFEIYRVLESKLKHEIGLTPSRETMLLAEQIQSQTDVVAAVAEPFVARVQEWRWLEQAWRSGQRVLLRGEPGVGKTRLLKEFARACGRSVWFEGRPGDQGVPFAAVTRFLRAHKISQLELAAWVKTELHILLPEIEARQVPTQNKQRLFAALLHCFEAISSQSALLVLDDWQFLDPSSLEFVFFLLEQSQQAMVATARSAELNPETESRIAALIGAQRLLQIQLPRLEETDLESLLRAMNLDTTQAGLLHKRTGGNPLYALESLRAGIFENKQLTQLIEARLERLSKPARDVARVAAITEGEFGLVLAAQILEVRELELLEPIDELQQSGLMLDMRFSHDLVLETLRLNMPLVTRRWLHQRTLSALENNKVNAAVLAFHAIGAAKPEAVLHWSAKAGAQAVEVYAYTEALEHHQNALLALRAISDVVQLQEAQLIAFFDTFATLLTQQSRFEGLYSALEEGIGFAKRRQWSWLEGALHNLLARALLRAGTNFDLANQAYQAAAKLTQNHTALRLDTLLTQHHLEGARGDWLAAGQSARAAAKEATQNQQLELLQEALMGALFAAQNLGDWQAVLSIAQEVRPISEQVGGRASLAHGWAVSGIASVYLGQPRRAIQEAENAFSTLSSIGWGSGQRFAAQALSQAYAELGDLEKALEQNTPTVFHEHAQSRPAPYTRSWWTRANLFFLQHNHSAALEALTHAKKAVLQVMPFDAMQFKAAIASLESAIWMQLGNGGSALENALLAAEIRKNEALHGWTRWTPHWLELRALCLGNHSALAEQRICELKLLEPDNSRWQLEILAAQAEVLHTQKKPKAALKCLEQAFGLAQQLDLPLRLQQLEQVFIYFGSRTPFSGAAPSKLTKKSE